MSTRLLPIQEKTARPLKLFFFVVILSFSGARAEWVPFEHDVNGFVTALKVFQDQMVAAGTFSYADTLKVDHIAAWNGKRWCALGTGLNKPPSALEVYHGSLFAAGHFSKKGMLTYGLAEWNGQTWSYLEKGPSNYAGTLCVYDGKLVVGGNFTHRQAEFIGLWDGNELGFSGIGTNASVTAVCVYAGDLFVGGSFDLVGDWLHERGIKAPGIAQWNGTRWVAMDGGVDDLRGIVHGAFLGAIPFRGSVNAFEVFNGNLIVGGEFTLAGDVATANVAQWNGRYWLAMPPGVKDPIEALCVYKGDLYAGGDFGIARWSGSKWEYYRDLEGFVRAFCIYRDSLFVGGDFRIGDRKVYLAQLLIDKTGQPR